MCGILKYSRCLNIFSGRSSFRGSKTYSARYFYRTLLQVFIKSSSAENTYVVAVALLISGYSIDGDCNL